MWLKVAGDNAMARGSRKAARTADGASAGGVAGKRQQRSKKTGEPEEKVMATIVEYSNHRKAINAYPAKIISPPVPSGCCSSSTVQVGEVQDEDGWPFMYHRCTACGFTVRRFAPRDAVLETRRIWRNTGREIGSPDAA